MTEPEKPLNTWAWVTGLATTPQILSPCICTPAIAGISDGPSVDCPVHGFGART